MEFVPFDHKVSGSNAAFSQAAFSSCAKGHFHLQKKR